MINARSFTSDPMMFSSIISTDQPVNTANAQNGACAIGTFICNRNGGGITNQYGLLVESGSQRALLIDPSTNTLIARGLDLNLSAGHYFMGGNPFPLTGHVNISGSTLTSLACLTATATVTGAVVGNPVIVGRGDGANDNNAIVSAGTLTTNNVTINICNPTAGSLTVGGSVYNVTTFP
jgi:hypothetical protein